MPNLLRCISEAPPAQQALLLAGLAVLLFTASRLLPRKRLNLPVARLIKGHTAKSLMEARAQVLLNGN